MDQKMNNGILPIHQKIYDELLKINKEYLRKWDIQNAVLSYRLKKYTNGKQLEQIRKLLFDLGLTHSRAEKILLQINYKFKLGLQDAQEIEKALVDQGKLRYTPDHKILIVKQLES